VTDGAANNPEVRKSLQIKFTLPLFNRATDPVIRRIRKGESSTLMRHLGLSKENLRFLSFPSGRLKECFPQLLKSLEEVFLELQPQEVYTVPFDHGGFEHDICNALVKIASRALPDVRLFEFPVLNIYKGFLRIHWFIPFRNIPIQRTPFTREAENQRLRLFHGFYRSQWFATWAEKIIGLFPSEYKRAGEPYRIMPEYDYSRRIDRARLNYHPRGLEFKDFQEIISPYLK
jgi:hypothetical protein